MIRIGKRLEEQMTTLQVGESMDPLYVFEETLDTDRYQDITSNVVWHEVGRRYYDYQYVRQKVAERTAVLGFSNLSKAEQEIASRYYVVDKTDRNTVHTEAEQQANWTEFVLTMRKTRRRRWDAAKAYVSYVLPMSDSVNLARTTKDYSGDFVEYGIEKKADDGVLGLYDYFENTGGISTWFGDKSYYDDAVRDRVMDILRNGNY